ncbi:MAG TPA: Na+/H+ antiporter subunit E [Kofleriaceae bacterium]|nr:Na+/H+ antiporter subunit E [Kofleriaceae bacterium]
MALADRGLVSRRIAAAGWRGIVVRSALLAAGWWILVAGDRSALGFGVAVVLVALAVSVALPAPAPPRWQPLGLVRFALAFVAGSIHGGIDVAARVLAPRVRIAPAMVEHRLRLPPTGPARNLLAGTLNLMPGTLSVEIAGDRLLVHALAPREPAFARQIEALERRIAHALGERLEDADA